MEVVASSAKNQVYLISSCWKGSTIICILRNQEHSIPYMILFLTIQNIHARICNLIVQGSHYSSRQPSAGYSDKNCQILYSLTLAPIAIGFQNITFHFSDCPASCSSRVMCSSNSISSSSSSSSSSRSNCSIQLQLQQQRQYYLYLNMVKTLQDFIKLNKLICNYMTYMSDRCI